MVTSALTSTMITPVEKWPQLSVLSMLSPVTVLDAVKVSNSEEVSDLNSISDVFEHEEKFLHQCFILKMWLTVGKSATDAQR